MGKKYRLRYAPSPTGYLHIGNTRTALMDYLFAKHYDGDFIVRIEDTDIARNVDDAIESQFSNLMWLGIIPDESIVEEQSPITKEQYKELSDKYGHYQQSMKFDRYVELAEKLIHERKAYKCFCTTDELEKDREEQEAKGNPSPQYNLKCFKLSKEEVKAKEEAGVPYSIRFHVPENKEYIINDLVRGEVKFESENIGDFVIVKQNGIATYNFAVVVDDHDMEITTVVRGEEHISNTPRQLMIYDAFGWSYPEFAHLSLIVDETHKKLSKRSGNALFFIEQYRNQGYLPQAVFNYIALLGWSPVGEQEILSKEELIAQFDEKRFSKSPSTFDMVKMKWINSQYMKSISETEYLTFIKPFIDNSRFNLENVDENWLNQVLLLFKKEIEFGLQINDHLDLFFNDIKVSEDALNQLKEIGDYDNLINIFENNLTNITDWTVDNIQQVIKTSGKEADKKGKAMFMPIRIFATKSEHGPSLAEVIYLLGKEKVLNNIKEVKGTINAK
ncbi:glutamate--tRNA ligase [Mesoplasma lactucae]|uniref:Glutamate--tRNA ligase n=1 Tax=Mesoplasma lactucae ATCC 49193 TaxID=81460 RepID=A0A291ISG1_9MOLU|nr:glutamate--tRNA ligase [Mesoplasma lactucae]ATG97739.1 glutamate--tRNA ligase [Mesoplasma lactucae ATCC 49193]ATZ20484.1 glutamyl-tRNA synthetase [Mesoplasma lactucae ATCC 49193]MCL8216655.1 Glutamate--tRNA ligase [Mesoplasma lactucae ATCC 49193]